MTSTTPLRLLSHGLLAAVAACAARAEQLPVAQAAADTEASAPAVIAAAELPAKPVNPPVVSCHGDQLAITADNATMGSILAAVRRCLEVPIDVPDEIAGSRTFLALGPGPIREVLDALLSSTGYDYVIQASNGAPTRIRTVLLMARNSGTPDTKGPGGSSPPADLTLTPARRAWLASRLSGRPAVSASPEEETARPAEPEPAPAPVAAPEIAAPARSETSRTASSAAAPDSVLAAQTDPARTSPIADPGTPAAPGQEPQATADAAARSTPEPSPAADAVVAPAAADAGQRSPASPELQHRIDSMQQLFEQRKKLNSSPAPAPTPN